MTISDRKGLIQRIVNVFETGTPEGDYGQVSVYPDGPGGRRQITYGRSQTTEYGHLPALLRAYVSARGEYANEIGLKMGALTTGQLVDDAEFLQSLRNAGADPAMRRCQDVFFDDAYWKPAATWAEAHGFVLPLSGLVIYDSFVHSGQIRRDLRASFAEVPPADGGDEYAWIESYVEARHRWLTLHTRPLLQKTAYRTRCFLDLVDHGNWALIPPITANGVAVS